MRMAPQHIKRNCRWEVIFIGVLIFLWVGVRSQKQREGVLAQAAFSPVVMLGAVVTPLPPPVAIE